MLDLHDEISAIRAISPVAIGTTGTGKTSGVINRQGFAGVEFIFSYGAITATAAVFTPLLTECATSGGSYTSVADSDMIPNSGGEAAAGIAAGTPRASGVNMNVTKRLGYRGSKQFLKVKLSSTATAGTPVGVDAILYGPSRGPVT